MVDDDAVSMLLSAQSDMKWFGANFTKFKKEFNNKFIAFRNKQVIDSDSNLDSLMIKLRKSNINTADVFIEFLSNVKAIL